MRRRVPGTHRAPVEFRGVDGIGARADNTLQYCWVFGSSRAWYGKIVGSGSRANRGPTGEGESAGFVVIMGQVIRSK